MTYGHYQEAVSEALVALLAGPPPTPSDVPLALNARAQLIATLQQRIDHLGGGLMPDLTVERHSSHVSVSRQPLYHLAVLVSELERPASLLEVAPSDVLRSVGPGARGPGEWWRTAARELFLATTELERAERKPWLFDPEAGWPLLADLADTVEALWLLEERLASAGVLRGRSRRTYLARVLLAGDVGRLARMAASSDVADLATAGWGAVTSTQGPGVALVRSTSDLAVAQRRLAQLLRPWRSNVEPGLVEDRPGLRASRVIAAGQAAMGLTFAKWAEGGGRQDLATAFRGRVALYRQLHSATTRLVDVVPRRNPLITLQQSEMSTMMRALRPRRLNEQQFEELDLATQAVTAALGKSLRREGLTAGHIQVLVANEQGVRRPVPIANSRHPFHAACKALADVGTPAEAPRRSSGRVARRQLRQALEQATLTTRRPLRGMSVRGVR